jgi:hypothetical protein
LVSIIDYDVANWYPSFGSNIMILKIISYLVIYCYVLTLLFIYTTSTGIVRLGDICNALRYSKQYLNISFLSYLHGHRKSDTMSQFVLTNNGFWYSLE